MKFQCHSAGKSNLKKTCHSQYKAEDEKVHELERDVAKYWKEKEVELAICGIENQSVVEKNMPFRVIGYDGTAYRSQLLEERKRSFRL